MITEEGEPEQEEPNEASVAFEAVVLLVEQFNFSVLSLKTEPTFKVALGLVLERLPDAGELAPPDWSLFFERRFEDSRLLRGVRRMDDLKEPYKKKKRKTID